MKIGILGTGGVGATIGTKLVSLGHEVKMGGRAKTNEKSAAWVETTGGKGSAGDFAAAAAFGELLVVATAGSATLEALRLAGEENLAGKIVIDISNPLDFSDGFPPKLSTAANDSIGEQAQKAFPNARFVKTLNTVTADLMVDPGRIANGEHVMFLCGDDAAAKETVSALLRDGFGWKQLIDLGGITSSRATEGYLPLWVRLYGKVGTGLFNIAIVK